MSELDPASIVPVKRVMPSTRSNYCICKKLDRKASRMITYVDYSVDML
jgi:hypothetical protein